MPNTLKTLAASLLIAAPAYAQTMDVPARVQPPAGEKAAMTWTGTGELTYECRAKTDAPSMFEWAFVGPDAKLWDAKSKASPAFRATLTPPALPRPPVCTCALITTLPPSRRAMDSASVGVEATSPSDMGMPAALNRVRAWYSWRFTVPPRLWFQSRPGGLRAHRRAGR